MRNKICINQGWQFKKNCDNPNATVADDFINIDLPYTWNGDDGQDGGSDYFRGKGLFVKNINIDEFPTGEEHFIEFEAVNSSADVYFNSKLIAHHDGGYSCFRAKLDNIQENNTIAVIADNSPSESVYPQMADFTFYGGIYRNVNIISVPKNHFELLYYGTPGIKVTPTVTGEQANIEITAYCENEVEFEIIDDGESIAKITASGVNPTVNIKIDNPHLWNGRKDPHLYTAFARILDGESIEDEISARFGIRTFEINPSKGFILNGKEYPLRGVSRHQDRPHIGNALLPEHHKEDMDLICEVGATTIRLAHYQHNQYFYDLCDERGLVIWAEIPYISSHLKDGRENTISQMTELITQNYNHPSIVVWGLSNEITISGSDPALIENHQALNNLCHKMDKTRLTTMAVVTMCSPDDPYVSISDVVSYNHYFGWYGGNTGMNGPWFDDFHKKYPNKAVGLSEYGCEALNWHTSNPEQGDYTEEYQAYYHEELIKQIAVRPYLWATHVWNMFDFAADARSEGGENGMNHKGLVTFDRSYKKDAFYAYKAWLSDEPVLHICSKRYIDRVEDVTKVTVYSNQPAVELYVNETLVASQTKGEFPFFYFEVKNEGESTITAKAGELTDTAVIRKVDKFNEDYRLKEEGSVINWFEITAPAGYLSINNTIGDIMATTRGKLIIVKFLVGMMKSMKSGSKDSSSDENSEKNDHKGEVMGFKISPKLINKNTYNLIKGFSFKRIFTMAGGMFTKEQILSLNKSLNKVKAK